MSGASTLSTRGMAAAILATLAAAVCLPQPLAAATVAAQLIGTFTRPVYVAVAPGYANLLFVVEQQGRIRVVQDGVPLGPSFLDITGIVLGPPDATAGGEQGLLSVAFRPDYATSGLFYVNFTNANGDVELNEFQRSAADPTLANPASRRVLLVIPHPVAKNHNGGTLQFGADGFLYMSVGDGGQSPAGNQARNLDSLLGKILRISPAAVGGSPYGVPLSNPFVGKPGRDEIYAYGLRNPWRFSFDGPFIAIADVGQNLREEVNLPATVNARGANFGWPQYEGNLIFDNTRPGAHPPTFPVFTYDHGGGRCAIVGGYVIRDPNLAALVGRYMYGDSCTGEVRSFVPNLQYPFTNYRPPALNDQPTGLTLAGLTSFGVGFNGRVYATQAGGTVSLLVAPTPEGGRRKFGRNR